jgi:hypothetical protein
MDEYNVLHGGIVLIVCVHYFFFTGYHQVILGLVEPIHILVIWRGVGVKGRSPWVHGALLVDICSRRWIIAQEAFFIGLYRIFASCILHPVYIIVVCFVIV